MPGLEAPSHWLILGLAVVVLFGYKKLPEMSRSLGRSLRIFKTEMKGLTDDDAARDADAAASSNAIPVPPVVAPTPPPVAPAAPYTVGAHAAGPADLHKSNDDAQAIKQMGA